MRVSEGREREREKPHERVEYLALIRANATNAYLKVFLFKSMSLALLCASECVSVCVYALRLSHKASGLHGVPSLTLA